MPLCFLLAKILSAVYTFESLILEHELWINIELDWIVNLNNPFCWSTI